MKAQIKRKPVPSYDPASEPFQWDVAESSYKVHIPSGQRPSTSSSTNTMSSASQGYHTLEVDLPKYVSQSDILDLSEAPDLNFGSSHYTLPEFDNEIQEVPAAFDATHVQNVQPPSKPVMGRARSQTVPHLDAYALPPGWVKRSKGSDRRGSALELTAPVYQSQAHTKATEKAPIGLVSVLEGDALPRQVARDDAPALDSDSDGDATDTEARVRARKLRKAKPSAKRSQGRAGRWSLPSKAQLFATIKPLRKKPSNLTTSFDEFWAQGEDPKVNAEAFRYSYCSEHSHSEFSNFSSSSCASSSTSSIPCEHEPDTPAFSMDSLPTASDTAKASFLPVISETGESIPFGALLTDVSAVDRPVKTIVCFIRHFMCPLCQDYMYSITRNVDPEELERAGLRLVVVGNGSWHMIKSYRRISKFPFPVYTDPTAALYTAFGMTLRTLDPGPRPTTLASTKSRPRASTISSPISDHITTNPSPSASDDTYVRHLSLMSGISMVLRNAVKARMPVWRYMGDKALLGGEFVFQKEPGLDVKCVWAHRMQYTTGHAEIGRVVGEASSCEEEAENNDEVDREEGEKMSMCGGSQSCSSVDSLYSEQSFTGTYEPSSFSGSDGSAQRKREQWVLQERERWQRFIGFFQDDESSETSSSKILRGDSESEIIPVTNYLDLAPVDLAIDIDDAIDLWYDLATDEADSDTGTE